MEQESKTILLSPQISAETVILHNTHKKSAYRFPHNAFKQTLQALGTDTLRIGCRISNH
jgi:hypothetical protein